MRTITVILSMLLLAGCSAFEVWKDDHIDPAVAKEVNDLNSQVIEGIVSKNQEKIISVSSDRLMETMQKQLQDVLASIGGETYHQEPEIAHQFYIVNSRKNIASSVSTGTKGEHDYRIDFKALNKESFVSVVDFKDNYRHVSLITIFGKYDEGWKMNVMYIGATRIYGKDAIDWYDDAKADYERGDLVGAVNRMSVAQMLSKPAGEYWKYVRQDEMNTFFDKVKKEAEVAYKFPVKFENTSIWSISPQVLPDGYFPLVSYRTTTSLADTAALARECDRMHAGIGKIFRNMDKTNDTILYRAFGNIQSTGDEEYYGFMRIVQ